MTFVFILALMLSPVEGIPLFQFKTQEQCELVKAQALEVNRDSLQCVKTKITEI